MLDQLKLSIANNSDIESVLKLQELYLVTNLTDDQKKEGFVTTPFNHELLARVIKNEGLFIAKDIDNKVIAYAFAESWDFFSQYPIFEYMISLMPDLKFENHLFNTENSFQYGPVCIDKKYRGKGLLNQLFELMRENVVKKYPLSLTFINKINQPSMKAHTQKLGWTAISEFQFNANEYVILAYDMKKATKM
jgi:hypothetical protein